MKLLIIGVGNMGKTYAKSLLANYFIQPEHLYLLDSKPIQDDFVKLVPKKNITTEANENIKEADIIILAVKPQDFNTLSEHIQTYILPHHLIISIMAGVTMGHVATKLNNEKIVRAMPNLPANIGMGMTVFSCTQLLDRKELFIVQNLLNATGKSIYVEHEHLIDAATAISGSGPAYVYYFMQAMIEKAESMGFSKAEAELMVNQTFLGAVHLHNQFDYTCNEWIEKVASKGGTTEAALLSFTENKVQQHIANALEKAFERAKFLGKEK